MAGPCQNKVWGAEKWGEKKAETDLNGRPLPKIRGDRVQGEKMGEGGTNERAETVLNGRPLPE